MQHAAKPCICASELVTCRQGDCGLMEEAAMRWEVREPTTEAEAVSLLRGAVVVMHEQLEFKSGRRTKAWDGDYVEHLWNEALGALKWFEANANIKNTPGGLSAQASSLAADKISDTDRPKLKTRPVAFRVQGPEPGRWELYDDEAIAQQEAEARDVPYQGLYVRGDRNRIRAGRVPARSLGRRRVRWTPTRQAVGLGPMDDMIEEMAKIIDPEAWGLPPTIEVENGYHDRETARDKARALVGLLEQKSNSEAK